MMNVRFDELELMLMAMFEQPTLGDTIQVLTEIQPLVAEDAEMAALVQQTIPKMQQLNEQQFKGWNWNGISQMNQIRKQRWQRSNDNRYVCDLPNQ